MPTTDASAQPRSRRAILATALAGSAAAVMATLGEPSEVRAGTDGDVVLGAANPASATTSISLFTNSPTFHVDGLIAVEAIGEMAINAIASQIAVNGISDGAVAPAIVGWGRGNAIGVLGWSTNGSEASPSTPTKTGVIGIATQDASALGVYGRSAAGQGVRGEATTGIGVAASTTSGPGVEGKSATGVGVVGASGGGTYPAPINPSTGVYGFSSEGVGVYGASVTGPGIYAANNASTVAAIVAEGGPGTAIHGHANAGPVPASPPLTGLYGSAAGDGTAIAASADTGIAVDATSAHLIGVRGVGAGAGVLGVSPAGFGVGVLGSSGAGSPPAALAKVGVLGYTDADATARGVVGQTTAGRGVDGVATTGYAVVGAATSGVGIRGTADTGLAGYFTTPSATGYALRTLGRLRFDKAAGLATIAAGSRSVTITPGTVVTTATAIVATLQGSAGGTTTVHRVEIDTTNNRFTIYLTANSTVSVKVAWHAFG
jgi:hypothetical protein